MSRRQVIFTAPLAVALAVASLIAAESGKATRLTADDYIEIQQLYADYAYALDQGQGERFAATFVDDGEFIGGRPAGEPRASPAKGHEALLNLGNRGGGRRHFLANLVITRTPGGAKASCYFLELNVKNVPATLNMTAIYDDTLAKTRQGWKFKRRAVWRDDDNLSPFKPGTLPLPQEKK